MVCIMNQQDITLYKFIYTPSYAAANPIAPRFPRISLIYLSVTANNKYESSALQEHFQNHRPAFFQGGRH